jgi:hypothetical protein
MEARAVAAIEQRLAVALAVAESNEHGWKGSEREVH